MSRVKYLVIFGAFCALSLTISGIPESSAIFGLSTCERTKSSILNEEKIGFQSWLEWNSTRISWFKHKIVLNKPNDVTLANLLLPVYQSDANVYKIALKSPQCFTSAKDASIRSMANSTDQNISAITNFENNAVSGVISMAIMYKIYPKYYSIYGNLVTK